MFSAVLAFVAIIIISPKYKLKQVDVLAENNSALEMSLKRLGEAYGVLEKRVGDLEGRHALGAERRGAAKRAGSLAEAIESAKAHAAAEAKSGGEEGEANGEAPPRLTRGARAKQPVSGEEDEAQQ